MFNAQQFLEQLPTKVKPEAIEGLSSNFHFDIADSGQHTVKLDNGKLEYIAGFAGEPTCKVQISQENLAKILSGELNPMMATMTGKLKISNLGEMMKYAKIFGLM